jgi:hypothetical protein
LQLSGIETAWQLEMNAAMGEDRRELKGACNSPRIEGRMAIAASN